MDPLLVTNPKSKQTTAGSRTREELILHAEQLFARHGLDSVSLRQINAAAGQRNSSAAHYHFGSKEALIVAIYRFRVTHICERRTAILRELEDSGRIDDPRELVRALVEPLVYEVDATEGGANYICFLAQLMEHPAVDLQRVWRSELSRSAGLVFMALRKALPHVPDRIFGPRFGMMWEAAINSLADRTRLAGLSSDTLAKSAPDLYVSNMVDTLTAGIACPVSEETRRHLEQGVPPGPDHGA